MIVEFENHHVAWVESEARDFLRGLTILRIYYITVQRSKCGFLVLGCLLDAGFNPSMVNQWFSGKTSRGPLCLC